MPNTPRACSSIRSAVRRCASSDSSSRRRRTTRMSRRRRCRLVRVADMEPLLRIHGVSKSFGGIHAVHDISFDVGAGESVGLVGPNGAGKTTLFNCVCGQLRNDEGDILFGGVSLSALPTFKRARLGIGRTYQKVEMFTDMSVRDHLLVAERSRRGNGRLWKDLLSMSGVTKEETAKI